MGRKFCVVVTKHVYFWESLEDGRWEPYTFDVFDKFITSDCVYFDVGSWIGPTILYGAQVAKQTYAFEPDTVAFTELSLNLKANRQEPWMARLEVFNKAISTQRGTVTLGSRGQGGDSMSSMLFSNDKTTWLVETDTLNHYVSAFDKKQRMFVKMDIEGEEYNVFNDLLRSNTIDKIDKIFFESHIFKNIAPKNYLELLKKIGKIGEVKSRVNSKLSSINYWIKN